MDLTVEQLKNMSDEEVAALNKQLVIKVMKRFGLFMLIKWAIIFGINYAAKRSLKKSMK